MSPFLDVWRQGLARSSKAAFGRLAGLLGATEITADTWDDLEALLLQADVGIATTQSVILALRRRVADQGLTSAAELKSCLREELRNRLLTPPPLVLDNKPAVILIVGVNGSGKTTTIAKLADRYRRQGMKVLLAAADTFRAAAIEQLETWANRTGASIVRHQPDSDPAAVVFDALQASKARGIDLMIADTAGRLHTKGNLMEELRKIGRVVEREIGRPPDETLLVLDATTGQNAVNQAREFSRAVPVTGVVLTKMDGTAKGGVLLTVRDEIGLPVKLVGVGEKATDLEEFDASAFARAMFE